MNIRQLSLDVDKAIVRPSLLEIAAAVDTRPGMVESASSCATGAVPQRAAHFTQLLFLTSSRIRSSIGSVQGWRKVVAVCDRRRERNRTGGGVRRARHGGQ